MSLRILSYNILKGGGGRERMLATVIGACAPDIVIFQEAYNPAVIEGLARTCAMTVGYGVVVCAAHGFAESRQVAYGGVAVDFYRGNARTMKPAHQLVLDDGAGPTAARDTASGI